MSTLDMRRSQRVRDEITRQQRSEIAKLYDDVYKDMQKEVERLAALPMSNTKGLQTMRINQLKNNIMAAYKGVYEDIDETVSRNMGKVSQSVIADASTFFNNVGITIGKSYASVPTEVIESIKTGKVYGGNWRLSKAIWGDYTGINDDISNIIAKGVAENKSSLDIAKELEKYVNPKAAKPWDWGRIYPGSKQKIDYNAQRLARTLVSHAYELSTAKAVEMNPFTEKIKWLASTNDRVCPVCKDRDGKEYTPEELPLDHPNGACIFIPVLTKSLKEISEELAAWVNGEDNPKLDEYMERGCIEKSGAKILTLAASGSIMKKEETRRPFSFEQGLKADNVLYNAPKPLKTVLTTEQIIDRVSGGDETKGSCVSAAYAYVGNRGGLDVLDFRGGKSLNYFAKNSSIKEIIQRVGGQTAEHTNDFTASKQLLETVEEGKEYLFFTGKHGAVIRKINGVLEYLELQDEKNNGFKPLERQLKERFGAQKSHTSYGRKLLNLSGIVEVDKLKNDIDFRYILGYLNTAQNEQKKGTAGYAK